jgi:hypothetical protein
VKFGIKDLHIILLGICELHENWFKEGGTYFLSLNETMLTFVARNCHDIWRIKNTMVKSVCCIVYFSLCASDMIVTN